MRLEFNATRNVSGLAMTLRSISTLLRETDDRFYREGSRSRSGLPPRLQAATPEATPEATLTRSRLRSPSSRTAPADPPEGRLGRSRAVVKRLPHGGRVEWLETELGEGGTDVANTERLR
jgi:hypothetical protein